MTIDDGKHAARLAALQMMASLKAACNDDLDNVIKVVKLTGFINSTLQFTHQATVMNGCSDLFSEVFGRLIVIGVLFFCLLNFLFIIYLDYNVFKFPPSHSNNNNNHHDQDRYHNHSNEYRFSSSIF